VKSFRKPEAEGGRTTPRSVTSKEEYTCLSLTKAERYDRYGLVFPALVLSREGEFAGEPFSLSSIILTNTAWRSTL
jgi:hypothetical protein